MVMPSARAPPPYPTKQQPPGTGPRSIDRLVVCEESCACTHLTWLMTERVRRSRKLAGTSDCNSKSALIALHCISRATTDTVFVCADGVPWQSTFCSLLEPAHIYSRAILYECICFYRSLSPSLYRERERERECPKVMCWLSDTSPSSPLRVWTFIAIRNSPTITLRATGKVTDSLFDSAGRLGHWSTLAQL